MSFIFFSPALMRAAAEIAAPFVIYFTQMPLMTPLAALDRHLLKVIVAVPLRPSRLLLQLHHSFI
jgi:hypothetical protein